MHMEVRGVLAGNHAVVLNQIEPIGVVCPEKGIGSPADGMDHGGGLLVREVEQSGGVTPGMT